VVGDKPYFLFVFESKQYVAIGERFPLQLGRYLLIYFKIILFFELSQICCLLLNLPNAIDWRACCISKDEETRTTERFKEKFAKFDFTLE
jgi:hypothetical protein